MPERGCVGDLPGDEIVVSPPSPIVEPLSRQCVRLARVQYFGFATRGKVFGITERRDPPGEVCPVRMLAGRPGLDVRFARA